MSGHNKWSKIKRQKEKTDSQKSKIFGKFVKLITVEAKKSGGNVNAPGLKSVIERARAANVPNDNIERAIKKFSEGGVAMEAITYEAYGPGGQWTPQTTIPISDQDGEKLSQLVDELEECDEVQDVYTNAE